MTVQATFHRLTVRDVLPAADDAVSVTFDVPPALAGAFHFAAGQHLTLRHGDLRRSYSICAAPGDALRVGVRRVRDGAFSGWLHGTLKPGDALDVMAPQGRFGAALQAAPRHVLAVAGGSGITPILSIVKALLSESADARCTLLYGNRSAASAMFADEIDDLKNRHLARLAVHTVFSREAVDMPLHSGRLDAGKVAAFLRLSGPVAALDAAFVSGPHAMNDTVEAALLAGGVPPGRIHIERFGLPPSATRTADPPAAASHGGAAAARVTVVRDGVARDVAFAAADGNILAAAERAGLDVPYSCRSGVCATCRAKLLRGQVRMDRNFALQPDDVAAGFVLTCQAQPLSAHVEVSFDDR